MFIHEASAIAWLQRNVGATAQYRSLTCRLEVNALGVRIDHCPFFGTVIEENPDFTVVQTDASRFVLVDPTVLREGTKQTLAIGAQVTITPYRRRQFDGRFLNEPTANRTAALKVATHGSSTSRIPVASPKTEIGKHLLDSLQRLRCPDGVRVLSNMLVDIGACNFSFFEGAHHNEPLKLIFDCSNGKFCGRVTIGVDCALNLFFIDMHKLGMDGNDVLQHHCEGIELDFLTEVISTLLCDGEWKYANVEVVHVVNTEAKFVGVTNCCNINCI